MKYLKSLLLFAVLVATPAWAVTETVGDNTVDDYSGSDATSVKSNDPSLNFSGVDFEVHKYDVGDHAHALVKFTGLSSIAGTVTVSAATLYIWQVTAFTGTYTIDARRLLRDWLESEASWDVYSTGNSWTTGGGLGDGTDRVATISAAASISNTTGQYYGLTGAQLATDVQNIINGVNSNYGWHLSRNDAGEDNDDKFFTYPGGTDGQRPYLEVVYTVNAGGTPRRHVIIVD